MSANLQTQKIRLKVTPKKITMNIKFPCSLTTQIKHDTTLDSRKLFELKNGECVMGQTLESECEVQYHPTRMRYEEKKVSINIFMVSMSGKVASGSVTFSLFAKEAGQVSECVQFLEKCPDKQAKIYFSFVFQVLRKSQRLDKTFFSEFREEHNKKKQSFNSVFLDKTMRTPRGEQRQIQHKKPRRSPSPINNDLNESIVQGVISLDRNSFKNQHKTERRNTEYSLMQQLRVPLTSKARGVSKNTIRQNLSNKSFNLQQPAQTERFQTQPQEIQQNEQLEKLRLKVRNLQRSDKGTAQMLRETKQQGERRKYKISQLQASKFELQEALRTRDERIKRLDKLLKQAAQQRQDIENQFKITKAQSELRENINKQQLKKWEDKYKHSETEREQITEEYNRALKTFEEGEKKYQVLLKEKQRAALEEKGRINKKLEQQIISFQQLEKQNRQLKIQIEDLNKEKKQLFEAYSGSEATMSNTNSTIESLKAKLRSQGEKIHKLQDELESLKTSEAEKQQLKKKVQQLTLNNNLLNQKLQKSSKTIESLQSRLRSVEQQSQKRNLQKLQQSASLNQLKKNYDNLKFSQEQKTKEASSLSSMHEIATSKINELKSKLDFQKRTQEESQRQFTARYNIVIREKQSLMAEGQQLRWELQKQLASVTELSIQLRALNDEIFRLNEQLLEKGEKIKKLEQSYKQLTISYQHVNNNFLEGQKKKRQLQGYCKERDNQYVQVKKRAERAERQISDMKERIRVAENATKQKIADLQRKLKQKQESLQLKSSQIQSVEIQLRSSQDESNNLKHQLQTSSQQSSHLKDIIATNRREIQSQETMILKLKETDSESKRIINQKQSQLLRCSSALQAYSRKVEKMSEEFALSKGNCSSALENFLKELIRDEESSNSSSQALRNRNGLYPDERIAALQIQYLQKHWQHTSKQRTTIIQLTQEKEVLQFEINRLKINLEEHSKKNQYDIIHQRQRIKALYVEVSKKEQVQKETTNRFEEVLNEKDRQLEQTRNQITKLEEEVAELQTQIKIMIGQYDSVKEENRELEQQILKVKSQQVKERVEWEAQTKKATQLLQDQISHLRQQHFELERKALSLEKDQADKAQLLKKYQLQMNVLIYERDKKQSRANELSYRVQEYQADLKDAQKQIREKDRELKKTQESVEQIHNKLREEKEKLQEALFKVQQQNSIIVQLYKDIQKSKEDLKNEQEKLIEVENINKSKVDTLRLLTEKQAQEIKQLKQKQIALSSELQLKKFMMIQLQNAHKTEKNSKEQLKSEIEKKKILVAQLTSENAALQLKIKQVEEQQSTIASEKEAMGAAVQRLKISISHMRASAREEQHTSDQVAKLQREIEKIKQEKNDQSQFYQRTIQDLKNTLREVKKSENSKQWKEQQLKKKLKTVQKLLDSTNPDLSLEKSRFFKELERQKRDLISRNEILQSRVDHLEDQLSSSKLRAKKQVQKYNYQIEAIKEEMNAKDFIIRNQQIQLDHLTFRINQICNEKSRVQGELQKERHRSIKIQNDCQIQQKAARQKLKKVQDQGIKNVIGQIQTRMESSRLRRLEGNCDELERVILSGSYRQLQQIVLGVAKERRP